MSAIIEQDGMPVSSNGEARNKRSRKSPKDQYTEISYEKKKQKAKDNRAKLTIAIEELEDAFHVAKNDSKERYQQYQTLFPSVSKSSSVDLMKELIQDVSNTKKWDRPSYIMSAAKIIEKLNRQCEALMDDLVKLKSSQRPCAYLSNHFHPWQDNLRMEQHSSNPMVNFDLEQIKNVRSMRGDISLKEYENNCFVKHMGKKEEVFLPDLPNILLKEIASFLDPISILRCGTVTKKWVLNKHDIFSDESLWRNLCNYRFGHAQVQRWRNESSMFGNKILERHDAAMKMYQRMKLANWKPSCKCEGNLYLGHSKINNVLSAWVSMVDRSNGETMRTVFASLGSSEQILLIPVVEVRILIQNTGFSGDGGIVIPEQVMSISSNNLEMFEIQSDQRFRKTFLNMDAAILQPVTKGSHHLGLFDAMVIRFYVHAETCSSTRIFIEKAKSAKLLISLLGNTVSLKIPFISGLQIELNTT